MIDLLEIELIKQLKYRYFRALDTKNWALITTCLTEDAVARYGGGKYSFDGRDNIIKFFEKSLNTPKRITLHHGHHPEINLTSPETATGIWYLQDLVIDLIGNTTLRGAGFYHDDYVKENAEWKIKVTGYERTYEEIEKRSDQIELTHNRFTK